MKGRSLLDTVASIRGAFGDAGLEKVLSVLDPATRQLVQGNVLANEWYPLEAMTTLLQRNLEQNDADEEHVVDRAEQAFARQLNGVYRLFIRLGSPEWVIKRIGAVHEAYFRNVGIAPTFLDEKRARIRYDGLGRQHRVLELLIVGFYRKALELSGASDRQVTVRTSLAADQGYCELDLSWR